MSELPNRHDVTPVNFEPVDAIATTDVAELVAPNELAPNLELFKPRARQLVGTKDEVRTSLQASTIDGVFAAVFLKYHGWRPVDQFSVGTGREFDRNRLAGIYSHAGKSDAADWSLFFRTDDEPTQLLSVDIWDLSIAMGGFGDRDFLCGEES